MKRRELHLGLSLCGKHATLIGVECVDGGPVGLGKGGDALAYVRRVFESELEDVGQDQHDLKNLLEFIAGSVISPVVELEIPFVYRESRTPAFAGFGPPLSEGRGTHEQEVASFLRHAWQRLIVKERRLPARQVDRDEAARLACGALVEAMWTLLARAQAGISPRACDSVTVVLERAVPHAVGLYLAERLEELLSCRVRLALPQEASARVAAMIEASAAGSSACLEVVLAQHLVSNLALSQARAIIALGGALVGGGAKQEEGRVLARRFGLKLQDGTTLVASGRAEVFDGDWTVFEVCDEVGALDRDLVVVSYWPDSSLMSNWESCEIDAIPLPEETEGGFLVLVHVDSDNRRLMVGTWHPGLAEPIWRKRRWNAASRLGV